MSLKSIVQLLCFFGFASCEVSLRLALALIRELFPGTRPHPKWTLGQTLTSQTTKSLLKCISLFRLARPLSLSPGAEGSRFFLLSPASRTLCLGPTRDVDIRPQTIGATWTPERPPTDASASKQNLLVALHFHGGAYVVGNGRDSDTGFLARNYLDHAGFTHVLTPQYRLASTPEGRFPAALQDALSAYLHLVRRLQIPAERIVLGADSAGGNLAIALLRYIS